MGNKQLTEVCNQWHKHVWVELLCHFCMTVWANQGSSSFKATDYDPHETLHYISLPEIYFKASFFSIVTPHHPREYCSIGISIPFGEGVTKKTRKFGAMSQIGLTPPWDT